MSPHFSIRTRSKEEEEGGGCTQLHSEIEIQCLFISFFFNSQKYYSLFFLNLENITLIRVEFRIEAGSALRTGIEIIIIIIQWWRATA